MIPYRKPTVIRASNMEDLIIKSGKISPKKTIYDSSSDQNRSKYYSDDDSETFSDNEEEGLTYGSNAIKYAILNNNTVIRSPVKKY